MRLRTRFILLITLAALVPLGVLGVVAVRVSSVRMVAKVAEVQVRTADALAQQVATWVALQQELLGRQVSSFELAALQDAERAAFLRLVYHQNASARVAALLDSTGQDLAPPAYQSPNEAGQASGRRVLLPAELAAFRADAAALSPTGGAVQLGFGAPRPVGGGEERAMVFVARQASGATLAVELDLSALQIRFLQDRLDGERLALLDLDGRVLMGDASLVDRQALAALPPGVAALDVRYRLPDGSEVLAATAPVSGTGWTVFVGEPLVDTVAPVRAIAARTLYVALVAGAVSVLLGIIIGRQITGPLTQLRDAALEVAEGDFGRRVESRQRDGELTELTHAFNFMSRRLQLDREEIAAKNSEIEAFNRELQARVDERTRQLSEAQERLIRSARMAAVGEMGAGLAHELNNPLAGMLGIAQILGVKAAMGATMGEGERSLLTSLEEQTRRCAEIVTRMQRFSRMEAGVAPVDREGWLVVDVGELVREVVELVRASFDDRGAIVRHDLEQALPVLADRSALAQALAQLLTSLRAATGPGIHVHIDGNIDGDQVVLGFLLDGGVLRIGKDDWMASGMGYWAARQVLAAHGGAMEEPTVSPTEPTTHARWRVRLPRA